MWLEHVNIQHSFFLSSAEKVRIPYAAFTVVNTEKTCIFIKVSPFCNIVFFSII